MGTSNTCIRLRPFNWHIDKAQGNAMELSEERERNVTDTLTHIQKHKNINTQNYTRMDSQDSVRTNTQKRFEYYQSRFRSDILSYRYSLFVLALSVFPTLLPAIGISLARKLVQVILSMAANLLATIWNAHLLAHSQAAFEAALSSQLLCKRKQRERER